MTDTSIPAATVIPTDRGISGDPDGERGIAHAAYIASLATQAGVDSYRQSGLSISIVDGTATIEAGLAMLRYEGGVQTYESPSRLADDPSGAFSAWPHPVVFAVAVPETDVMLDGEADVWLALNLADESVYVRHGGAVEAPNEPAVQLASVAADGAVEMIAPDHPPIDEGSVRDALDGADLGVAALTVGGITTHYFGASSIHGPRSRGEVERWVGGTADWVRTSENSTGRVSEVYNAYYDGKWRYQVSDEPASRKVWSTPEFGGQLVFQTADAGSAGDAIDWRTVRINNGTVAGEAVDTTTVDAETATLDALNGTSYAAPGEVQDALDAAAALDDHTFLDERPVVKLLPNTRYAPDETITVPKGVELSFNGAELLITGDYNALLVNGNTAVRNIKLFIVNGQIDGGYSSAAIVCSTELTDTFKYGDSTNADGPTHIDGRVSSVNGEGTGLLLEALGTDGNGTPSGFALGNEISLHLVGFEDALRAHADDGAYVNCNDLHLDMKNAATFIHHIGAGPFQSTIDGTIQCSVNTNHLFVSEDDSAPSMNYVGRVWDPPGISANGGGPAWVGTNITAQSELLAPAAQTSDGSDNQRAYIYQGNGFIIANVSEGTQARLDVDASGNLTGA